MKLALIGHRGIGKSGLLHRIKKYLSGENLEFVSLDQAIEESQNKSIDEIFSKQGESTFREIEKEVFAKLYEKHSNFVIDIGAGFEGKFPKDVEVIWVQRAIDASQSQFLDRPSLDGELKMDPQRYFKRELRYYENSTQEIELLQHFNEHCDYEEKYFQSFLKNLGKSETSWFITLYPKSKNLEQLNGLTGCGFELRDDLLDHKTIQDFLKTPYKTIVSLRNFSLKDKTLSLVDENQLWDWPLEWGNEQAPILSLHERKDSLAETLSPLDSSDSILKVAVPIQNYGELKLGYDWFKENPEKRVFLPSSKEGRWSGLRLLMAHQMQFSFFRQGRGSSVDQPTLLEVLSHNPELSTWCAIIGQPVKHSFTPSTHDAFFKRKKANILRVDLGEEEFSEGLNFLQSLGLRWAAVTSPLKNKAWELVKNNQESELKATNTLCFNSKWFGENTDIDGIKFLTEEIGDRSVAIWGGGGTLEALREFLPQAHLYSSRTGRPRDSFQPTSPDFLIWSVGAEKFNNNGVFPPADWSPKKVIDLNYTQDSPGILCAHRYGCQYRSGLDMFIEQARKQQEFWDKYGI